MNPKQLLDLIIKPTLKYMGGNYQSRESEFLLLCTAAIESDCGYYFKQVDGPALGIWQMEPETHDDIWQNCDALDYHLFIERIEDLVPPVTTNSDDDLQDDVASPMYACAMARLKYSMDPHPLPKLTGDKAADSRSFYEYYKRVYNTELGASTYVKWVNALRDNNIWSVKL